MAENIVKIKVQTDTSGVSELNKSLEDLANKEKKVGEATSYYRENQKQALQKIKDLAAEMLPILEKEQAQFEAVSKSVANFKLKEIFNSGIVKDFNNQLVTARQEFERLAEISKTAPARIGSISRTQLTDPVNPTLAQLREYYSTLESGANVNKLYPNLVKSNLQSEYYSTGSQKEIAAKDFAFVEAAMAKHNSDMLAARKQYISSLENIDTGWKEHLLANERFEKDTHARELSDLKNSISQKYAAYNNYIASSNARNVALAAKPKTEATPEQYQTTAKQSASVFLANADAIDKQNSATNRLSNSNSILGKSLAEIIIQYRAINFVYNEFLNALYNIPKIGIQLESTTASLTASFKSEAGAIRELTYLNEEAARTGIPIATLRESYQSVTASMLGAGQSAEHVREIFANINTVATTLHLSADKTSNIFLALGQIFNKDKVQAEELTKQLGQVIPGVTTEQAKALGITVSELYDRMKKGALSADEAVLKLTQHLAQTYGFNAFEKASTGLNSQLGRLTTAWTLFTENLYKDERGVIGATVKGLADFVDKLREVTSDTGKVAEVSNYLVKSIAGAAAGFLAAKTALALYETAMLSSTGAALAGVKTSKELGTVLATTVVSGFNSAISSLKAFATSNMWTILAVAVGTAFGQMTAYADRFRELEKEANASKAKAEAKTPAQIRELALKEFTQKEQTDVTDAAKYRKDAYFGISGLLTNKEDKDKADAVYIEKQRILQAKITEFNNQYQETLEKTAGVEAKVALDSESIMKYRADIMKKSADKEIQAQGKVLDFYSNTNNQKDLDNYMKAFSSAVKSGDVEGQEKAMQAIETYKAAAQAAGKDLSGAATSANNAFKTELNGFKLSAETQKEIIGGLINDLTEDYQNHLVSITGFYEQKKALQTASYVVEKNSLEDEINLAKSKGDTVKASQLAIKAKQLEIQYNRELSKTTQDNIKDNQAYLDSMIDIQAQLLESAGKVGDASKLKIEKQYRDIKALATKSGNKEDISNIEQLTAITSYNAEIAQHAADMDKYQQKYNDDLAKTNILVQTGSMSEFEAAFRIKDINDEYIKQKERQLELDKASLEAIKKYPDQFAEKTKAITKAEEELKRFKLTSNTVESFFRTQVTNALGGAFSDFIKGTKTAKEAFISFANSILDSAARIAANAIANQIISGVISLAGNYFGGGTTTAPEGTQVGYLGSTGGVATYGAANGAIFNGPGISAYSGTVVNTPTIFPFASGTGLMGEAGPEAILPLKRNSKGKLGVSVENSSSNNGVTVGAINVTVQAKDGETSEEQSLKISKAIRSQLELLIDAKIQKSTRVGSTLNPTTISAVF